VAPILYLHVPEAAGCSQLGLTTGMRGLGPNWACCTRVRSLARVPTGHLGGTLQMNLHSTGTPDGFGGPWDAWAVWRKALSAEVCSHGREDRRG
jgi:hypothetical protein